MANDGGPAFAGEYAGFSAQGAEITITQPGMTLRDYFAAAALPKLLDKRWNGNAGYGALVAKHAYEIADAMLVERERFRS